MEFDKLGRVKDPDEFVVEKEAYEKRILSGGLGEFGKYVIERAFDGGMRDAIGHLEGIWKSWRGTTLQKELAALTPDQRAAVEQLVELALTSALHNLLHGISHDRDRIRVLFGRVDVGKASDGLHGDLFTWIEAHSRFAKNVLIRRVDESMKEIREAPKSSRAARPSRPPAAASSKPASPAVVKLDGKKKRRNRKK